LKKEKVYITKDEKLRLEGSLSISTTVKLLFKLLTVALFLYIAPRLTRFILSLEM